MLKAEFTAQMCVQNKCVREFRRVFTTTGVYFCGCSVFRNEPYYITLWSLPEAVLK